MRDVENPKIIIKIIKSRLMTENVFLFCVLHMSVIIIKAEFLVDFT